MSNEPSADQIELVSADMRSELMSVGADIRRRASPKALMDTAQASLKLRVENVPARLSDNSVAVALVLAGGAIGVIGTTAFSNRKRETKTNGPSASNKRRHGPSCFGSAIPERSVSATAESGSVVDRRLGFGVLRWDSASREFNGGPASCSPQGGFAPEDGRFSASPSGRHETGDVQSVRSLPSNRYRFNRGGLAGAGYSFAGEQGRDAPAMKRGDLIRLGLAYALIATSGKTLVERREPQQTTENPTSAAGEVSPAEIPARAWREIAKCVWVRVGKDRVVAVAAGLTFYAILALFPAITALVSVYGIFADPTQIQQHLSGLSGVVPEGALSVVGDQIKLISANGGSTLGLAFFFGLAVALWSANSGMKALFDALNVAYEANESRSFVRLNAISLLFTLSAIALTLVALSGAVILPWVLDNVFPGYAFVATLIRWLTWPIGIAAALLGLAVVYRFGPDREKPLWRWVTPGSLLATLFLILASAGFAYYAANFGSYNKTYGTLGAAIAFMTWLWISSIVVLVGAELNAETEAHAKGKPPTRDNTAAPKN